jgi:alkylation response protein AidB-like acyl-CoA dehydrogenase
MTALTDIRTDVGARAADVEGGRADVRAALRALGDAGLLGPSAADGDDDTGGLATAVRVVRAVAAEGLATAFCVWSQRMVLEYLRCCPPSADVRGLVGGLRSGLVTGGTALAPAVADLAGRGELPVVAERDGDGWRLTGSIHWASNLFDGAVVVTPARTPDEGRVVVLFGLADAGVELGPVPDLLALNGTGTRAIDLHGVAVPRGNVLTDDLAGFVARCRPAMLLMQSALAVGLADASLAESARHLTGLNAVLAPDHDHLARRHEEVAIQLDDQATSRTGAGRGHLARVRLDAIRVATDAVTLETALCGGSGFRADSATSRRVREAAFLPIQAPTLAQLRHDAS